MKNAPIIGGLVIATTILAVALVAQSPGAGDAELRTLRAENKALRAQVASLRKHIAALEKTVKSLRNGSPTRAASHPAIQTEPAIKEYFYRGRKVSKVWFDRMYKEFADKILILRGKFFDVGAAAASRRPIEIGWGGGISGSTGDLRWPLGKARHLRTARILRVVSPGEAIVILTIRGIVSRGKTRRYKTAITVIFHVNAVDARACVEGATLRDMALVRSGYYDFVSKTGAKKTVPSYRPHRSLTRHEFALALAEGFILHRYRKVTKLVDTSRVGSGFGTSSGKRAKRTFIERTAVP